MTQPTAADGESEGRGAEPRPSITGILLAAGRGMRFYPTGGRDKLLQPLDAGTPVAAAAARKLLQVLPRVIAVVRPGADAVAQQLQSLGCTVVVCAEAHAGMAASLVHALRHAQDAGGWIIALADMPHIRPTTLQSIKTALELGAAIAAPVHRGRRGNPVGFGRQHLARLLALEGDQGARSLLKQFPVQEVEVDDNGILLDIDTPQDLLRQGQR